MVDEKPKTRRGLWKKTQQPGYKPRKCSIDGCGKRHKCSGFCDKHYMRFKSNGNPLIVRRRWGSDYVSLEDYLNRNHQKHPESGCWVWSGTINPGGYGFSGNFSMAKDVKMWVAHRLSFYVYKGPIPDGLLVCHKCDNRSCVNPDHLFLGTQKENMEDMHKKGRANQPKGELSCKSKLKKEEAIFILENKGVFSSKELGIRFGVSRQTIENIWNGVTKYINKHQIDYWTKMLEEEE